MGEYDFPFYDLENLEQTDALEGLCEHSSSTDSVESSPPEPDLSYEEKLDKIAKKYKMEHIDKTRFKSYLWMNDKENLTLEDLEDELAKWRQKDCQHVWKPIQGIFKTYYNCIHCDIKKENA
jgi:hypothetical protein